VGTDFIEKTKRSFDKHLDRQKAKLATADLFTQELGDMCQTFPAVIQDGAVVTPGEALVAEVAGGHIILTHDLRVVAIVADPPVAVLNAIQDSCGIATALVQEVHMFSGIAEVTLC
jgi:nicotinate-nucleotide pyrophosphorylase